MSSCCHNTIVAIKPERGGCTCKAGRSSYQQRGGEHHCYDHDGVGGILRDAGTANTTTFGAIDAADERHDGGRDSYVDPLFRAAGNWRDSITSADITADRCGTTAQGFLRMTVWRHPALGNGWIWASRDLAVLVSKSVDTSGYTGDILTYRFWLQ